MPDPFNKAKMTGDTHPPEVESDLPLEEGSSEAAGLSGTPRDRGRGMEIGRESKPTRGVKKAGLLQDHEGAQRQSPARDPAGARGPGTNPTSPPRGRGRAGGRRPLGAARPLAGRSGQMFAHMVGTVADGPHGVLDALLAGVEMTRPGAHLVVPGDVDAFLAARAAPGSCHCPYSLFEDAHRRKVAAPPRVGDRSIPLRAPRSAWLGRIASRPT